MAPPAPVAHRLVPSSGSTAISTESALGLILGRADLLADEEHRRLVALAFADDDGAVDGDGIQAAAHGFHGGMVGGLGVSHAHGARRGDGGFLHDAQHFQREVEHGSFLLMDDSTVLVLADPTDPLLAMLEALPDGTRIAAGNRVEAFTDAAPEADVILNWTGSRELLRQVWQIAPQVRWIHSRSAGLDELLFPELAASPVPLTNARGVFSEILGEFAISAVLFFAKGLRRMVRSQEAGIWDQFDTVEVAGQTMGIIGWGDIGKAAARRAEAMGMHVRGAAASGWAGAQARPAGTLGLRRPERAADAGDARNRRARRSCAR